MIQNGGDGRDAMHCVSTIATTTVTTINTPIFEWQPNYYDHIIRNEQSFKNISNYIRTNPEKWDDDRFKPPE